MTHLKANKITHFFLVDSRIELIVKQQKRKWIIFVKKQYLLIRALELNESEHGYGSLVKLYFTKIPSGLTSYFFRNKSIMGKISFSRPTFTIVKWL